MIECLVLGDSIGVGIGSASHCQTIAKVGINSKNFVVSHKYIPIANTTVISLGSNDGNADFSKYMNQLRSKISGRVVWILSNNNAKARNIALNIARQHGDSVVYLSSFATADGVHPKSYSAVARKAL
jgi:DNA mismatch repair protein MutH